MQKGCQAFKEAAGIKAGFYMVRTGGSRTAQSKPVFHAQGDGAYLEVTLVRLKEPREGESGIRHTGHENLLNPEMDMESLVRQAGAPEQGCGRPGGQTPPTAPP